MKQKFYFLKIKENIFYCIAVLEFLFYSFVK